MKIDEIIGVDGNEVVIINGINWNSKTISEKRDTIIKCVDKMPENGLKHILCCILDQIECKSCNMSMNDLILTSWEV